MRKNAYLFTIIFALFASCLFAQKLTERPKLVVGIVVDQMKQEYLLRFYNKFGEGGFKRLVENGFMVRNGHYNYIPTYTGPGHASVYTGTTPATHGVIANNWYSRELKRMVYCAEDTTVTGVGGTDRKGEISPKNMLTTTVTDELRLSSNKRSKVIGMSIKDRGAALPAGHMGDAAYWYDPNTGEFMSSTFYMEELPRWVKGFNNKKCADKYLNQTWQTLLPIDTYIESGADDTPYETILSGKDAPVFPYHLKKLRENNGNYGLLPSTPFGNTILTDFAKAALDAEKLGKGEATDFLAISYSSTDYIGHAFGPASKEVQDTYLRLDRDLESLLNVLDAQVGQGKYVVFLSADHAVADVPQYMKDQKVPAGNLNGSAIRSILGQYLLERYGEGKWVENASNDQIFLNRPLIQEKKLDLISIQHDIAQKLLEFEGIAAAYTADDMNRLEYTEGDKKRLQKGYNAQRSGDVLIVMEPAWLSSSRSKGTTHGSGYTYDTHVPIIFYGWGIKQGSSVRYTSITDIAPSLSMLLNIRLPNGASGQPIHELFD